MINPRVVRALQTSRNMAEAERALSRPARTARERRENEVAAHQAMGQQVQRVRLRVPEDADGLPPGTPVILPDGSDGVVPERQ